MRPVFDAVCQRLIVVSNCMPGSAHCHDDSEIWRNSSRALTVLIVSPVLTARSAQSRSSSTAVMNSSVTRTELLAFWYWIEWLSAVEVHVEAGVAQRPGLALLDRLAPHELFDVGVVDVEDDHLGGAPRLAARLDRAGRRVGAAHEAHRARRGAAALQVLLRRADAREVDARNPEPPLKIVPSSRYQLRMASIVSSTARMKHADACCGTPFTPMLNHTGLLNGRPLVHEQVLELVAEGLGLVVVDEVAVAGAPVGDRVGDPVDHLAQRPLPLGRAEGAPEVLLGDDVGGVLRPAHRELDVGLEEGVGAVLVVGDAGVATFPLDGVVGVLTGRREVPADPDAELLRRHRHISFPLIGPARPVLFVPAMRTGCVPPASGQQTTISCGSPPPTRDGGVLQHLNYTRVNGIARASVQVRGLS